VLDKTTPLLPLPIAEIKPLLQQLKIEDDELFNDLVSAASKFGIWKGK